MDDDVTEWDGFPRAALREERARSRSTGQPGKRLRSSAALVSSAAQLPVGAADSAISGLPWIQVAENAPYFVDDAGRAWTPIGHNDAITWPTLRGLFRRRDLQAVDQYLGLLSEHGVTCLRLMLEYAQTRHRYLENPVGTFVPGMVQLWDDLLALCARHGLRVLLTPFDTFWTWRRWRWHPYNQRNGGYLAHPSRLLLCPETRAAIKARLSFAVERWGGSGVVFAWDLWNEIHPGQAEESADCFGEFIHDLSTHVSRLELELFGRSHPQTVSLFGPELWWRPHMPLVAPIFQHPDLDFATIHTYEEGTIDFPVDTIAGALAMGRIVAGCLEHIRDLRPFLDSEHGPIHSHKDYRITLPEHFDDEYFRHMQWAHVAAGAAGGGMRWPNRKPHVLTPGMHRAQQALASFTGLIDWTRFRRRNIAREIVSSHTNVAAVACGDEEQAVVWLVRTDAIAPDGTIDQHAAPVVPTICIPGLASGTYRVTFWDTVAGCALAQTVASAPSGPLRVSVPPFAADIAMAITRDSSV